LRALRGAEGRDILKLPPIGIVATFYMLTEDIGNQHVVAHPGDMMLLTGPFRPVTFTTDPYRRNFFHP
jgi:hypothetical protein